MHSLAAIVFVALLAAASGRAAIAAADPPDDDAAALQLADRAPTTTQQPSIWRLYGETAGARSWLRDPASPIDGIRASLDLRYDANLAPGVRAVLSDRLDLVHDNGTPRARNVNALREAYVSWQARPDVILDLGRVNLRHGAAWGYNPTDFFRGGALRSIVTPDPASLRENRLGTVVVQAQQVWSDSSLSVAFSPKLASTPNDATLSLDLGSTNARNRWLLVASHKFADQFNPQLLLHGGAGEPPQVGFNLSSLLNSATVAFVETSVGKGRSLRAQALGLAEADTWQRRAALGLTYTTSFNLSLTAEADFNSAAPNRAQWDALRAGSPAGVLALLQTAQARQELPVRRAAFFYATWRDVFVRRLDLSAFVRQDLVTHSRVQWLETRYHWDATDLALQWQQYSGGRDTLFGQVPRRRTLELSARHYF